MQKIKILLIIIMGTSALMTAQSVPQGMNYQAVARDHSGAVIANQSISIKVTLQSQKEPQGYTEIHKVQTNNLGLFTFIIGNGVSNLGDFQEVPWSTGDIWMELSIDANGGDNYDLLSENKILTVPYAFHAATASEIIDEDLKISGNKAAGKKWSSAGNAGLNDTTDKLGTTDDVDLVIVTNDTERMRISKSGNVQITNELHVTGNVGIGTTSPTQKLEVSGDALISGLTIGRGSGDNISNTAIGLEALNNNTPGGTHPNTLLWPLPSYNSTRPDGTQNTAIGKDALFNNTIGFSNTAVGNNALWRHREGDRNTAIGHFALINDEEGFSNTAIGSLTLIDNITGNHNTALGFWANVGSGDLFNATAIGANAVVGSSNSLVLGNNVSVGIGTSIPDTTAILDLTSTTKGFLPPRMDHTERDAIASPEAGLMIYCTNCGQYGQWQGYNGVAWTDITGASALPAMPLLTTAIVIEQSITTAMSGGNIISQGEDPVTARGVCWSTSPNPTLALPTKTSDGTGGGAFTSILTGLSQNVIYHVRAYATNSGGTNYGEEKIYKVGSIFICDQEWMNKNLDLSVYANGDPVIEVANLAVWDATTSGAFCHYDNNATNSSTYGKLYNWYAVNDPRGLAPAGWHIPSEAEWTELANCLGGIGVAGGAMKEVGTAHWLSPNAGATNSSGFTGLPGGYRFEGEGDYDLGNYGVWWSSTYIGTYAGIFFMSYDSDDLYSDGVYYNDGYSVRCIKD